MPISFPGLFGDWAFNPDPIAIHVGHGIYWYGIILAAAMLAGLFLCMKQAKHYGLTEDNVLDFVLWAVPSCIIGSALSGALSMVFGCALRAPHGGIFVFPVVDHALLYVVALAVGSAVGAVILSLLKKTRTE